MISYWVMMGFTLKDGSLGVNFRRTVSSFSTHLHYFLFAQSLFSVVSGDTKYFTKQVYVNSSFWPRFFLLNKLVVPNTLSIIVDGAQYRLNNLSWVVQFNTTSMLLDNRVNVYTNASLKNFSLLSVSPVYSSCIWLERELSDFTNINFVGLTDTRRLLLDYFEEKASWDTHISNDKNYNNTIYDIALAY